MTISNTPKVLFLDSIKLATSQLKSFQKVATVIPNTSKSREEFLSDLNTKYKDVSGIYRHFKASESIKITGRFDEELVGRLPSKLKFIAHNGAGYDQIDIPSCTSRGIQVSNVPTAVDEATADTAMFLLIGAIRQFSLALSHARAGTFNSQIPLSNDPKGKVLGIIGMGGIGSALARRALPFGMKVQYHNRKRVSPEKEQEINAKYVDTLDELLSTSDVISLNLPLNDKTKHLISDSAFAKMKPSAILINTARGPIVDEAALVRALEEGKIAGCGLDVYEDEPRITQALLDNPKALCLPHVGTVTVETQTEMEAVCLRNLEHGLTKGKMGFVVAEQAHMLK
ncbi:hypothetical protein CI109_104988 [Kwoniella shandongensis]|uniref:Uncharacterized protein n=1 Tax=Kwoniella shandongensis TaxID=1734106 RepID=A0A5M6BVH6_9TREE|nr:uncharacterized protein CI109_006703 [Kwoniella shandongensis]KAA5524979.1 hypothetical protein CI109_006703 [Kwoniella shandongensis]